MGEKEEGEKVTFRAESMCWGCGYEKCHGTGKSERVFVEESWAKKGMQEAETLYYRSEWEVLSFSEFRGNVSGLKMKSPTTGCIVCCAPIVFSWVLRPTVQEHATLFIQKKRKRKHKRVKKKSKVPILFMEFSSIVILVFKFREIKKKVSQVTFHLI